MDVMRVKQILSSSAEIEVKYHGASVWIDQLNEDGRDSNGSLKRTTRRTINGGYF